MHVIKREIKGNNFNTLTEVIIKMPEESVLLKISEEVEGVIRQGLIKGSNIRYIIPMIQKEDIKRFGPFK